MATKKKPKTEYDNFVIVPIYMADDAAKYLEPLGFVDGCVDCREMTFQSIGPALTPNEKRKIRRNISMCEIYSLEREDDCL